MYHLDREKLHYVAEKARIYLSISQDMNRGETQFCLYVLLDTLRVDQGLYYVI